MNKSILKEINEFDHEWSSYLAKADVDEDKVKEAQNLLNKLSLKVDKQKDINIAKVFGSYKYDFVKSSKKITPDLVGFIKKTKKNVNSDQSKFFEIFNLKLSYFHI